MKPEQILNAVGEINDEVIVNAKKKPAHLWTKVAAAAACLILAVGAVILGTSHAPAVEAEPIVQLAAAEEGGPRKFLNYNGFRYAYLEQGASYALPEELIGESLGTLEHQIVIGQEDHLKENLAATFGVGGTLLEVTAYDPDFRLAVELDGTYYLCEKTDYVEEKALDAAAYFETADFANQVTKIKICDHTGADVLKTVRGGKADKLLEALAQIVPAELTSDQYQQIGEAQRAGESFLLSFCLADGTTYEMYVIPSMEIAMLGDNRYELTEAFTDGFGAMFAKLPRKAL